VKIHIVKKGETLYQLAEKYDVDLNKLIEANPQIKDPDQIDVGMKIKIPAAPAQVVHSNKKTAAETELKPIVEPVQKAAEKPAEKAEDLFAQYKVPAQEVGSFYDIPEMPETQDSPWGMPYTFTNLADMDLPGISPQQTTPDYESPYSGKKGETASVGTGTAPAYESPYSNAPNAYPAPSFETPYSQIPCNTPIYGMPTANLPQYAQPQTEYNLPYYPMQYNVPQAYTMSYNQAPNMPYQPMPYQAMPYGNPPFVHHQLQMKECGCKGRGEDNTEAEEEYSPRSTSTDPAAPQKKTEKAAVKTKKGGSAKNKNKAKTRKKIAPEQGNLPWLHH
jgi:morphogenetic protein associated with SpoVID